MGIGPISNPSISSWKPEEGYTSPLESHLQIGLTVAYVVGLFYYCLVIQNKTHLSSMLTLLLQSTQARLLSMISMQNSKLKIIKIVTQGLKTNMSEKEND